MTKSQNGQLNALLTQTNMTAHKADLVLSYTAGRSESRADLSEAEAAGLIAYLRKQPGAATAPKQTPPGDAMRKKIIHMARTMGWETPERKADMPRINAWCKQYGQFHKRLNDHSPTELPALVTQMEKVYASYLRDVRK